MAENWQRELWKSVENNESDISTFRALLSRPDIKNELSTVSTWDSFADPLHWAARLGKLDKLKALLEARVQVNSFYFANGYKYTALHEAVFCDKMDSLRLLIQHGADPTIRGNCE